MSMDHKAYEFDYKAFQRELEEILFSSLKTGSVEDLIRFVNENIRFCKYPWDSARLPETWQDGLETGDAHEVGDYAMTKFYDPDGNYGLTTDYMDLYDRYPGLNPLVLGRPFGPKENLFDPGKMGSYFLKPEEIGPIVTSLKKKSNEILSDYAGFLDSCLKNGKGAYNTF